MNKYIINVAHKIGMDKAIAYGASARVVQTASGVITLFFITAFLTGVEQGYYFTFNSLLAVQTFFELGFTNIITQFVAHEVSHITINGNMEMEGDNYYKSRLSSLLKFSIKWYSFASLLFLLLVISVGFYLFNTNINDGVSWEMPWLMLCVATSIKMFQSPITAILMGMDKVVEMNKVTFYQQVVSPLIMWIMLMMHCSLYVLGVSSFLAVMVWFIYIWKSPLKKLLINIYKIPVTASVNYFKEIFPYQWRIAVSSISGYFIFHFMTPILFRYQGAVVAGQVGMTISIGNAIQSFSMTWLNTKVPLYSHLISLKQYKELDVVFYRTLKQMLSVCIVLLICSVLFLTGLDVMEVSVGEGLLSDRFLKGIPLIIMMLSFIPAQFSFSWATYLRCHKREPFMWNSLASGILCLIGLWLSAKYTTILMVVIVYALIKIPFIPWGYYIFKKCKREWHNQ